VPGLTLARIGGHFDGAAVLHWPAGAQGHGALLTGDTITVVQDPRLGELHVELSQPHPAGRGDRCSTLARRAERFAFDRVYGPGGEGSSYTDGGSRGTPLLRPLRGAPHGERPDTGM